MKKTVVIAAVLVGIVLFVAVKLIGNVKEAKRLNVPLAGSEDKAVALMKARHGNAVRKYASLVYLQNGHYVYMAEYATGVK